MKKKYLNIVETDINETYKTNISSNDILNKTDYFEKNKIEPLRVRKWRISFVSMTLSFILAITCIIMIQFEDHIKYVGQSVEFDHNKIVQECIEKIKTEYIKVYNKPRGTIIIDNELYISIYCGTNNENAKEYIYFYIVSSSRDLPVTLKTDEKIVEIDEKSSWGVLTDSSIQDNPIITLEIEYNGKTTIFSVEK